MFEKLKYKLGGVNLPSASSYFSFSFGIAPAPGKDAITPLGSYHSCREGLISDVRSHITGSGKKMLTDKMRMIFKWHLSDKNLTRDNAEHREWLNRGLNILHAYEKLAGWPLTKVFEMHTDRDFIKAYYFLSSRRWIKASYLVSLYVLMVRLGKNSALTGFKNSAGFEKLVNGLIEKYSKTDGGWKQTPTSFNSDVGWLKSTLPYWGVILKGYSEMFRKMKITHYWSEQRLTNEHGQSAEGIDYLCGGSTSYKEARKKLLELSKKK